MNQGLLWISGLGLGAGLMYLLDPERGRRRRTLLRDRAVRTVNRVGHFLDASARDVAHRTRGLAAEACSLLGDKNVPDEVLTARVRSRMGRIVSHPHSIQVTVDICGHLVPGANRAAVNRLDQVCSPTDHTPPAATPAQLQPLKQSQGER